MFSLSVTDKEHLCCVLDIVSLCAGKLVIDSSIPFDDLVTSVFVSNASVFASSWILMVVLHLLAQQRLQGASGNKLKIELACPMSHSVIDAVMKSRLEKPVQHNNLLMGCTIHSKMFQGENFCGC